MSESPVAKGASGMLARIFCGIHCQCVSIISLAVHFVYFAKPAITLPDSKESELAQRGQDALAAYLSTRLETQRIAIVGEDDETYTIELPTSAMQMLVQILGEHAAGNRVQVVLDACVLYPARMHDLLMYFGIIGLVRAYSGRVASLHGKSVTFK